MKPELGVRILTVRLKDMKLNPTGRNVDLPGSGGGEMDHSLLVSDIPKANRPINCIIERIQPGFAAMSKKKRGARANSAGSEPEHS